MADRRSLIADLRLTNTLRFTVCGLRVNADRSFSFDVGRFRRGGFNVRRSFRLLASGSRLLSAVCCLLSAALPPPRLPNFFQEFFSPTSLANSRPRRRIGHTHPAGTTGPPFGDLTSPESVLYLSRTRLTPRPTTEPPALVRERKTNLVPFAAGRKVSRPRPWRAADEAPLRRVSAVTPHDIIPPTGRTRGHPRGSLTTCQCRFVAIRFAAERKTDQGGPPTPWLGPAS